MNAETYTLIFGPEPVQEDVDRWRLQKFIFSQKVPYLLEQAHGGPCGVLAPVQGFLLAEFNSELPQSTEESYLSLSRVLSKIASNCGNAILVDCHALSVLDFLALLIANRGIDQIKADMDDPSAPLIGRFGHCSQEVLNLVLFGRATSNVFDGDQTLDESLVLSGVPDVPITVGLLSELEALRYVTVGSRLKNPALPIWVLGSPTHYTVLVGEFASQHVIHTDTLGNAFRKYQLDDGLALEASLVPMLTELTQLSSEELVQFDSTQLVHDGIVLQGDFEGWARRTWPNRWPTKPLTEEVNLTVLDGQVPVQVYKIRLSKTESSNTLFLPVLRTRWPNMYVHLDAP